MTFHLFKLTFPYGLHVGATGYGLEDAHSMVHSDQLFSALCVSMGRLYGDTGVEDFLRSPDVFLSSCFPFSEEALWFPILMCPRQEGKKMTYPGRKRTRKMSMLPQSMFEANLAGILTDEAMLDGLDKMVPPSKFIKKIERPRVTVDRVTNAGEIFHFGEVHFAEKAGLFFLLQIEGDGKADGSWLPKVSAAVHLLGDEGIGSDRSVGKGLFTAEHSTVEIKAPPADRCFAPLSLYNPSPEETSRLEISNCWYDYTVRNGWVNTSHPALRRQSVRMLTEGSVLTFAEPIAPQGRMLTVLSQQKGAPYDVRRSGRAIFLPVISKNDPGHEQNAER